MKLRVTNYTPFRVFLYGLVVLLPCDGRLHSISHLDRDVADAFGLIDGNIVSIDVDRTPGMPVSIDVPLAGRNLTLDLEPSSCRTDDFVFLVQQSDGSLVERDPGTPRTLHGSVSGFDGSRAVGSMLETGLAAKIVLGDGRVYFIEPVASKLAGSDKNLHVVYSQSDVKPQGGKCGVSEKSDIHNREMKLTGSQFSAELLDELNKERTFSNGTIHPRGAPPINQVAELAVDADFEFFTSWGTEQATRDRIELVINIVNDQFIYDVNIIHSISTIIVRTSEPDPYSSTAASSLLSQCTNHWEINHQSIQRDVVQLFTGKELDGTTIGNAWGNPGICTSTGYSLVQSNIGALACSTDLSAHELGHNWSAGHCNCTSHTMNPILMCANSFHPTFTIPEIINYRNSLNCLDDFDKLFLPFTDDFPLQSLDASLWEESAGVLVGSAENPPSAPFSAILDQNDILESHDIDTSAIEGDILFSFHLEERFAESGDQFFVEYLDSGLSWVPVHTQDGGDNGNQTEFELFQFMLGSDAKHGNFKIRFRSNSGSDDFWYVDDVCMCPQLDQGFDVIANLFPPDLDGPIVNGWRGALRSQEIGISGLFQGNTAVFDAHSGAPQSYVAANFQSAQAGPEEIASTWLISPETRLSNGNELSFWTRTVTGSGFPDRLLVRMSTNGGSLDVGSMPTDFGDFSAVLLDINPNYDIGGYPEVWTEFQITLSGLPSGITTGRIAFHYFYTNPAVLNGNYIGIDTVKLTSNTAKILLGDANGDGVFNNIDIASFVLALTNPVAYQAMFPDVDPDVVLDMNGDGAFNNLDIAGFVAALTGGGTK